MCPAKGLHALFPLHLLLPTLMLLLGKGGWYGLDVIRKVPPPQVIVGVNKYANGDDSGAVPQEVDVRKIDNSAVLVTQKERLAVSFPTDRALLSALQWFVQLDKSKLALA